MTSAKMRFLSLERRFKNDQTLKNLYVDFMTEYLNLIQMTPIKTVDWSQPHYVIPHHGILKPQCIDATTTNVTLNDLLMVGPTIQQTLIITLLSFRLHKYA